MDWSFWWDKQIPLSSGLTCFPQGHGTNNTLVPCIHEVLVSCKLIIVAFICDNGYNHTSGLSQQNTHYHLMYSFCRETDGVYFRKIYNLLDIENLHPPLPEQTWTETPHSKRNGNHFQLLCLQNSWYDDEQKNESLTAERDRPWRYYWQPATHCLITHNQSPYLRPKLHPCESYRSLVKEKWKFYHKWGRRRQERPSK